jgi:malonyl CoA-acyl carrier protein transacylase
MKTYVFPGQGSQARGMGGSLFDEFPELVGKADKILGYSIKELCLSDPQRELSKTQFTQPALYVVNALSYCKKIETDGLPDFVAGHSLGEFNALLAAECFDFETGLRLVKKRGELMMQATEGAMAAILNLSRDKVESLLKDKGLDQVDVANYNTPLQIVISGPAEDIAACQEIFQFDNVMYVPLNTSGAFHSRLMLPAKGKFESFLKKRKFANPKIPVVANLTAKPYEDGCVADYLAKQICSTVLWSDTIQYLMTASKDMAFVEIGHGDVLTKMIAKIQQHVANEAAAHSATAPAAAAAVTSEPLSVAPAASNATAAKAPASRGEVDKAGNPFELAKQLVAQWNERHPVGTKVKSLATEYGDLVTRTQATVLFGHRAAVYMEGYNGYFDLTEIAAA